MEQEKGLYTSGREDSYKSCEQIQRDNSEIVKVWDNPFRELSFDERIDEAIRKQEVRLEEDRISEEATVAIITEKPIAICNIADTHGGALHTDYRYWRFIIDTVKNNDNAFCFLGGDLLDSIGWTPSVADNILNFQQQYEMLYAMFKELKGKIIAGVKGNHNWEEKTGVSKYQEFYRNADAPMFENIGWVKLHLMSNKDDIQYNIALAHQLRGYSYHNPNHPQGRFSKEVEGIDVIVSNHTHSAGVQSINKGLFGGTTKPQTFINGFTLKRNDLYLRQKGNPNSAVGANWLYLSPHEKLHFAIPNTELAYEIMGWKK